MKTLQSLVVRMFLVGLIVLGTGAAWGQSYPNKPIRIITAAAGGVNDVHARAIAPGLSEILGQPVIVENRGGSSLIPIGAVAKAAAGWLYPADHCRWTLVFSPICKTFPMIP